MWEDQKEFSSKINQILLWIFNCPNGIFIIILFWCSSHFILPSCCLPPFLASCDGSDSSSHLTPLHLILFFVSIPCRIPLELISWSSSASSDAVPKTSYVITCIYTNVNHPLSSFSLLKLIQDGLKKQHERRLSHLLLDTLKKEQIVCNSLYSISISLSSPLLPLIRRQLH